MTKLFDSSNGQARNIANGKVDSNGAHAREGQEYSTVNGKSDSDEIYNLVKDYYGRVLSKTSDLKTSACCAVDAPPRYIRDRLALIPNEVTEKYYGCGTVVPSGIDGLDVLDLGSGSGVDCYLAAALVGPKGTVTGVDMTREQVEVARSHASHYSKTLGYPSSNLFFEEGYIEFLENAGIVRESMDLIISNCVVNLSPNKERVLKEAIATLRTGGELYFSDVYCSRRLPQHVREHKVLFGECLAGALYIEDFKRLCHKVGFTDPRMLSFAKIDIEDEELLEVVGEAKFYSISFRCFKLDDLETLCEDYGQIAMYEGGISGQLHSYKLDSEHQFEVGRPVRVCGNTASMLQKSWLRKYFRVLGDRSVHYGLFDCSPASSRESETTPTGRCC